MSSMRWLVFAVALLLFVACLSIALADQTVTNSDGTTKTTHTEKPVNNPDGSTTTTTTYTSKGVDGKIYQTETFTVTTFPYSTVTAKTEDTIYRPEPATFQALSSGKQATINVGFLDEKTVTNVALDGSRTSHFTRTRVDPQTGTKTVEDLTATLNSDHKLVSGERHTTTTPTDGAEQKHTDEVYDPADNKYVPAVQDNGKWVPAPKPLGQAPPHHNNTAEVVGGILALGGIIAVLASHGSSGSAASAIMFTPSSLTGCSGATATAMVSESGYSGFFTLSSSNPSVVQPTSPTTTGSFAVMYGSMKGTATITATDSTSKQGTLGVTVNC